MCILKCTDYKLCCSFRTLKCTNEEMRKTGLGGKYQKINYHNLAGVKQGCVLSPKMFCPFSSEVASEKGEQENMVFLLLNLTDEMFFIAVCCRCGPGFTHCKGVAKSTKRAGTHFCKDRTQGEPR